MTAWAFGKAGVDHPELFRALSNSALQRIEEFSPQGLSNLVWAFATVAWSAPEPLCYAVAKVAFSRISEFNEHDLAMTAWAFAKTGVSHPKLFHGLAAASFLKMGNFSEQDLANIAWAFAKAGVSHPELFRALSTTALQRIGEFSSQGLSNLAWAFATTAWSVPQPVFHAVAKEALPRICEFNQLGLTMTAWAFAKVGVSHPELFKALSITALQRIDEFSSQGLSNLAWASVQADLIPTRESDQLLEAIAVRARQQNWSVLKPEFGPPSPSAVEARCAELVQQWIHGSTRNRYFMGFELDIVFEADDGTLINLEIDEPYHGAPKQSAIDGRRDSFLNRCGVHVVRFPAFDESGPLREDCEEPAFRALLRNRRLLSGK
ncbi:unnamed protein product [Polarella glacialis]|uniref:RNA-editing substrate-binding complex 6 protein domain-containing protein n=1 Tax=Polarella glacialis TaxID=89957 RepID=A0A813HAE0_POLGL|nr:unnamed protein product [Polarella glacialis]